jgi:cytochrome d ubiquinol oxidase subunit II
MPLETAVAGVLVASLTLYVLGGGADFGGGVWDLFATGRRGRAQRDLVAEAIGPIWEANHVWLVLALVLLFVAFPLAFAALATALHVPLTLMLVGIVLRGSAFTFRTYDDPGVHARWSRVFAVASVVTPVMLGVCVGAVAAGGIRLDPATGAVRTDFVSAWLRPFPFAVGFFTLALFAFLAAVYLTVEAEDPDLREDFRRRALLAAVAAGAIAFASLLLAREGAPQVWTGLAGRPWSLPFHAVTGLLAMGAIAGLWTRRFRLARALAAGQVTLVLWGWAASQYPYVLPPDLTLAAAAAPDGVLRLLLAALAAGAVVLVPSLVYLFRVFKGRPPALARIDTGAPGGGDETAPARARSDLR